MRRELYKRPSKPLFVPTVRREQFEEIKKGSIAAPIAVDSASECHVTPANVASRMVDYLEIEPGFSVLEPSAGTGQLFRALVNSGIDQSNILMIERHIKLANELHKIGTIHNECFLEWAANYTGTLFDRVIMNPPFSQVKKHMERAISLLSRAHGKRSVLVALVPITYDLPDAETLERLPVDTFATAKVNTKIIRIIRHGI